MPRPRSRSPRRRGDRKRSRSRSRSRERRDRLERDRRRDRRRSRSRSPFYNRRRKLSRSPPPRRNRSRSRSQEIITLSGPSNSSYRGNSSKKLLDKPPITDADMEGKSEEEIEMMKIMGFSAFDTTKGKSVSGSDESAVHVIQKRKYRQYMNRRGGFNRPLDFVA